MAEFCLLVGFISGIVIGYNEITWHWLYVGGLICAFGHLHDRPLLVETIKKEKGEFAYLLYFLFSGVVGLISPVIGYFIALLFV